MIINNGKVITIITIIILGLIIYKYKDVKYDVYVDSKNNTSFEINENEYSIQIFYPSNYYSHDDFYAYPEIGEYHVNIAMYNNTDKLLVIKKINIKIFDEIQNIINYKVIAKSLNTGGLCCDEKERIYNEDNLLESNNVISPKTINNTNIIRGDFQYIYNDITSNKIELQITVEVEFNNKRSIINNSIVLKKTNHLY